MSSGSSSMASQRVPSDDEIRLTANPRPDIDRKALREEISKRYEHTLRRLGR